MWGFLTCLNDILVPHLKAVFNLDYVQASLIQFVFFGAYFVASLPAGKIVSWLGYQRGMVAGLIISAFGTLLFYPAASLISYPCFLGALFVLASGITVLQVAANPFVAALGKPETASSRLNLAQAFNSLGTTIAPQFGGWLILAGAGAAAGTAIVTDKMAEAAAVKVPYLILTAALLVLAVIIGNFKLPKLSDVEEDREHRGTFMDALRVPHLSLGCIAIFLYVGAEVSIGSYLINFMSTVVGISHQSAAAYVSYYWGGAMVGRFIGSALLQRINAGWLLGFNAIVALILCVFANLVSGWAGVWAALLIGLFNSIMFPNIFTLGIRDLGHLTSRGSSLLIMAIVGGAIVPVIMGYAADHYSIHHSFFVPAICYLYVVYYGFYGSKIVR
ncbi:MAG: glucose/galactose MFS transporter [Verrucomicrobia bacterium]|nr:MAG: glucose/galactose MFS transporter [Verrucomicrobiota bacterium]